MRNSIERAEAEQASRADDNRTWALRVEAQLSTALGALRLSKAFIESLAAVGGQTAEEKKILEAIDAALGAAEPNEPDPNSGPINLDKGPA